MTIHPQDLRSEPTKPTLDGIVRWIGQVFGTTDSIISSSYLPVPIPIANLQGLLPISSTTASTVATVDFQSLGSTYAAYLVEMSNVVPVTDDVNFNARVESGGSFQTTSYRWTRDAANDGGAAAARGSTSDSVVELAFRVGSAAGEGFSGIVIIGGVANTSIYKKVRSWVGYEDLNGAEVSGHGSGAWRGGTGAITGLRFGFSSGNIESGVFTLYGLSIP